jgi:heavy metal sensor kinase
LTIIFILLVGAAYWLLVYTLSQEMDASLRRVADALIEQSLKRTEASFPMDVDDIFRRFFGYSPLDRHFEMLDPLGHRRSQTPSEQSRTFPLSTQALENLSQGLHTYETYTNPENPPVRVLTAPVIRGDRVVSLVQVGMSLKQTHETQRRFLTVMLSILAVALLLAGGGGWLLIRKVLAPVEDMTRAAEQISAQALSERLEETDTGDELDQLAKTLNHMLARLDAAFSQIRRFSADASHELQTPLTILKGELEVALRSSRSPEEYRRILRSALEEIDGIARLVEGLLLLARADAGVMVMDKKPVNLSELLEEIRSRTQVLADAGDITLVSGESAPVFLDGDYERLRMLLLNLVENAVKYTPAKGRVILSLEKKDQEGFIRITDTGIGIPQEEQDKIFQPFFRGTEARSHGKGVGLGLAIASSIAAAHGGRIGMESTPGQGTAFTFSFPIKN